MIDERYSDYNNGGVDRRAIYVKDPDLPKRLKCMLNFAFVLIGSLIIFIALLVGKIT